MKLTYIRLHSGDWGIRSSAALTVGTQVSIAKRNGSSKMEVVGRAIWFGSGAWIYAIGPSTRRRSRSKDEGWRGNGCAECRALGDWCKSCAFDEFDN